LLKKAGEGKEVEEEEEWKGEGLPKMGA